MPQSASAVTFTLGFVIAAGLLHLSGIPFGSLARFGAGRAAVRSAGALIALASSAVEAHWRLILHPLDLAGLTALAEPDSSGPYSRKITFQPFPGIIWT